MARPSFGKTTGQPLITFNEATRLAAKEAEKAAAVATAHYRKKYSCDEDDVTGVLVGSLASSFNTAEFGGIHLNASILRHRRGVAAEESKYGADMLIHVSMNTPNQTYSKGVLIQAKKVERTDYWSQRKRNELIEQCNKMLRITPASFVCSYSEKGIRFGSATRVAGATSVFSIPYLCGWSSYRFFLELFRCPIGDPKITSAHVGELPEPDVPFIVELGIAGDFDIDPGSSVF